MPASDAAVGRFAIGLHEHGADIAMLFFAAGALLWYSLFVRTRFVPRWLGWWGLASVVLVCLATLLSVWDRGLHPPILLYVAYTPYELFVGIWLLVKGSPGRAAAATVTRSQPLEQSKRPTPRAVDVRVGGSGS